MNPEKVEVQDGSIVVKRSSVCRNNFIQDLPNQSQSFIVSLVSPPNQYQKDFQETFQFKHFTYPTRKSFIDLENLSECLVVAFAPFQKINVAGNACSLHYLYHVMRLDNIPVLPNQTS